MKKKFLCLFLCLSLTGIFTGCDKDLFKIQGEDYENSITEDENGYQSYYQGIDISRKPEITGVKVTAKCTQNIQTACSLNEDGNVMIRETVGIIGEPIEFEINDSAEDVTLTFKYNPDELRGIPEKNITPMYINFEESVFKLIYDFELNIDENTVSFSADESGTYILLDIYQYGTAMGMEVSKYAYEIDKTMYESDWERECDTGDILKLADKKWTVDNAPTYHISTPEQLAGVVYYVNAINEKPVEIYLESDLDLSQYDWKPMGWKTNFATRLTFHGQNHTVNGLTINCPNEQEIGFTGYAWSIIMDNVSFTNVNITGWQCVGGFSGECYGTKKFTNVSLSGKIYGYQEETAAFIGRGGNGIYTDCKLDVTVNDQPCYFFSSTEKFEAENIDETAFTLSVNEKNHVQRTENEAYTRIHWVIFDGDTHLMSRGAEDETEIPDSLWEYLKAEKGKTYTVYMEAYKSVDNGRAGGYIRVSNILKYVY